MKLSDFASLTESVYSKSFSEHRKSPADTHVQPVNSGFWGWRPRRYFWKMVIFKVCILSRLTKAALNDAFFASV